MLQASPLSTELYIERKVAPPHPLLTWERGGSFVGRWCTECRPSNCTVVRAVIWAEISTPDNFQLCSDQRGGMARCNPLPTGRIGHGKAQILQARPMFDISVGR